MNDPDLGNREVQRGVWDARNKIKMDKMARVRA